MDLKENYYRLYGFEERIDVHSELYDVRTCHKNFENKGFPKKKTKPGSTLLNALLKNDFTVFPKHESAVEFSQVRKYFLHEVDTYKVVFVDGVFSSYLSSTHEGIDVCLMSSALNKPKYKMIIDNYYNQIATKKKV
jgi:Fe-S cluster assembly protein SufD